MSRKKAKKISKKSSKKATGSRSKRSYVCPECGLVVRIVKECGCGDDCDLVCCDQLMILDE